MTDLLALTAELVDIPSVSHDEAAIADHLVDALAGAPWLTVSRVGDNVVARTELGRPHRLVLAGHTDTVPANGNERARVEGDVLHGLGACDMKGGLAVFLELARTVAEPAVDVTYVFYVCEEVGALAPTPPGPGRGATPSTASGGCSPSSRAPSSGGR